MKNFDRGLVWFRRDLRDYDHAALYHALKESRRVYCVFVFDTEILDALTSEDRRVEFILRSVEELHAALTKHGGGLIVIRGRAREEIPRLARQLECQAVYTNRDYEPQAKARDAAVQDALWQSRIEFNSYKDQTIFDHDEILSGVGKPFHVYTPYKNAWLSKLEPFFVKPYPVEKYRNSFHHSGPGTIPTLEQLGFVPTNLSALPIPTGMSGAEKLFENFLSRIDEYHRRRDYPASHGPSYLSVHLRFGTISIRRLARMARSLRSSGASMWLSELIWRDFYFMLLDHYPETVESGFDPRLRRLSFPNRVEYFQAWCEARTGYPIVDAAMRQINQTGYIHNRLRMVTASFLVKDLRLTGDGESVISPRR